MLRVIWDLGRHSVYLRQFRMLMDWIQKLDVNVDRRILDRCDKLTLTLEIVKAPCASIKFV